MNCCAVIRSHPGYFAAVIGVLLLLIVVLAYAMAHYKALVKKKDGFTSPFPQVGPAQVCGRGWDPAASAEAQALATVGALPHDGYAESKLQGAVDGAFDTSPGPSTLNDEQLTALMHNGGAM
jgi:hypothetical protein